MQYAAAAPREHTACLHRGRPETAANLSMQASTRPMDASVIAEESRSSTLQLIVTGFALDDTFFGAALCAAVAAESAVA